MTEQVERRPDATRMQILRAASRQFAHRPYSLVSLDDILADAQVTKGAMYFHFRSKHALATAIVEHSAEMGWVAVAELLARGLSGLEALIDISYLIAVGDITDEHARAALNLLASIGGADELQAHVVGAWVAAFTDIGRRAIAEGDIDAARDPDDVARLLVSMYLGLRQTSNLNEPQRLLSDLEKTWGLLLPGFTNPDRLGYLTQFIRRRTALAIKRASPLRPDDL